MGPNRQEGSSRSPATADGGVARVEALLAEQHGLFTRLDHLSGRQASLIQQDETDQLLEVLAERQLVVEQITRVSALLEPWRGNWTEFVAGLAGSDRQRVRERVDVVALIAQRIAERDENDRKLLEQRKDAIATELGQVDRGRNAMSAYSGGADTRMEPGPRFQDREA